ncbi:MAG: ribose 5-phosphate isomerase A [Phycisphaerales bacterium]
MATPTAPGPAPSNQPDPLAQRAVSGVRPGMTVGLGTGRAATRAIHALAARAASERLDITCVATSVASHDLGLKLGLKVIPMEQATSVDFLFDGADEVDPQLRMVKGRGGAMTREKIVAAAVVPHARGGLKIGRVYLIDDAKLVRQLGEKMPLPIEVMRFGLASVTRRLAEIGLSGPIRQKDGKDYLTDNNNLVIDAALPSNRPPEAFAQALDAMEGIIDHGLFLTEADEILIEDGKGNVRTMTR